MAEYYAVERSPEYLAHHGVPGMKWGRRNRSKAKLKKWLKGLKEDVGYASKSAGLSLLMGPYAATYVSNQRVMKDPNYLPNKPLKKKRRK